MDNNRLIMAMISYYSGDPKRVQHFLKVYQFAKIIGEEERLDKNTQYILETAAIVHDIGIKMAEEKWGDCNGKLQEQEGPAEAEKLLKTLEYEPEVTRRVSYLVGHHHTYSGVDGMDYRILLEADALVNIYEDNLNREAAHHLYEAVFRTKTGKKLCHKLFGLN
ncbi:MAG: HD domain-containing protein [Lachnospiraceae bacterium]|nr:HD domain-containing protein [Lachnospiraceae bacterium]